LGKNLNADIKFTGDDLKTANAIQSGLAPTDQKLEATDKKVEANTQDIQDNKQQIQISQQQIQTNHELIQANQKTFSLPKSRWRVYRPMLQR
jgi:hypothetical protein